MFENYILVAWRNLLQDKLYSVINILGLSIGIASFLMLALFIRDETVFDSFWPDAERLYIINSTYNNPGGEANTVDKAPGLLKQTLESYFNEEIESVARLNGQWPILKTRHDVYEEKIYLVDPETVDVLDFNVLKGDIRSTLQDNASIALSETLSIKFFGTIDSMGEVITVESWDTVRDYRVGAIYSDLPQNTMIGGISAMVKINEEDYLQRLWMFHQWDAAMNNFIVKLKPGVSIDQINDRLDSMISNHVKIPEFMQSQFTDPTKWLTLTPQALTDVYLAQEGRTETLSLFIVIAISILLIACINFTNLSITKLTKRGKEVAMRKVMGASKTQLVVQFFGEMLLITTIALVFSVVMVNLIMPFYNEFLERELTFQLNITTILSVVCLILLVGAIGGLYPALVLSKYRPALFLKANKSNPSAGSFRLRNALVVFQFTVSVLLIVASTVIYAQKEYVVDRDLGYEKDNIVLLLGVGRNPVSQRQQLLQDQVKSLPGITSASYIRSFPARSTQWRIPTTLTNEDGSHSQHAILFQHVDEEYLNTFGVKLLAGRFFEKGIASDELPDYEVLQANPNRRQFNTLVNETAVYRFGLGKKPEDALGKTMDHEIDGIKITATIIGVLSDMNFRSVREQTEAEIFSMNEFGGFLAVRFTDSPVEAAQKLERFWKENVPELPFIRTFITELIDEDFAKEAKKSQLLAISSMLAVVISCMGLFGLASFSVGRRVKEIGIRKVMGASVFDIVKLLIWQFTKPVLIACAVGCALGAILMQSWLQDFPYRIGWEWIALSGLAASSLALLVAWSTIYSITSKVARTKPIKALKYK